MKFELKRFNQYVVSRRREPLPPEYAYNRRTLFTNSTINPHYSNQFFINSDYFTIHTSQDKAGLLKLDVITRPGPAEKLRTEKQEIDIIIIPNPERDRTGQVVRNYK